ncbi:MAG TPA: tRNA pseudouridine(38-40) synthase TruA [Acidimicrobiia bacterium]|nr:tRNA pseudouridine(38-40) synthase TruA [Acidimicrobiia bacterium]
MPKYRLDLSYLGSGFRGLARQPGQRTVQGEVEASLSRITGEPVTTVAAGRTDAGVHARQQVLSFSVVRTLDEDRVLRSLSKTLAPEIAPFSLSMVDEEFDARHSAKFRVYRYRILNREAGDPLRHATVWHVPEPLDIEAMDLGASRLVGEHDFAAFCRASSAGGTRRRVISAGWAAAEVDMVEFEISAQSFCHQMVRSIVGFSVEVGRGRRGPQEMSVVLASRDRSRSGQMAPARGLLLWEVGY